TAVLFFTSFTITRADEGNGTLEPPPICAEFTKPESTLGGVATIWLRQLCGTETTPATLANQPNQLAIPQQQQALNPDVPVNDPSGDGGQAYAQSTTSSAINANTGSICTAYIDVFHGQNEGTGYIGFSRSTDNGDSFEDRGSLDPSVLNYGNPSLAWRASDGYFYLTAPLDQDKGTGVWRSTDDCQNFDYYADLDLRLEYGVDDMQILAVDNSPASPYYGRLYVVWYGEFDTIQFSRSDDAQNWSGRITVSPNADFNFFPKTPWVTTAPNGDVFVFWNQNSYPWDADWMFSIEGVRSENGGDNFSPVASPLSNVAMPREATVECGFRVPGLLGGIAYYPPPPQIVAGADGVLHMVYSYDPDGFGTGDVVDVFYRRSVDSGQTWEPEVRLNDDDTLTDQFFPTLSVNEHGRVVASWYDRRDDDPTNFLFKYYLRTSFDNGLTWETSQAISDVQSPVFADPSVMPCYHGFYDTQLQTTDSAYLFWADNRNITNAVYDPDVFSERIDYPADFALAVTPATQAACTTDSAVYDVALTSIGGYNNPVALSASGEPAGASVVFGANPLVPDGTTTLTLANLAGSPPDSYTLTITGTEGALVHAASVDIHLADALPAGVTLVSPPDTAVDQSVTPTFSWNTDTTAITYTVEIATNTSFTDTIHTTQTSDTSYTPTTYLDPNTTYYWRVISHNGCGDTISATASFTTHQAPAILLVDDDDNNPDVRGYYTEALDGLGESYDIWDTNGGETQPAESDLAPYRMVIWFTGGDYEAGPSQATESALTAWLPQNNCTVISSQAYLNSLTAFRSQYLGVRSFLTPYPPYYSVSGEWVVYGGLGPYDLSYPFYESPKAFVPNTLAHPAFVAGLNNAGLNVANDRFTSTTLGFPLEAAELSDRQEILATALDWCNNGVAYGSLTGVVTDFDAGTPIKNATITADDGNVAIAFHTNANGEYRGDLRAGSYTVTVEAANYQSQTFNGIAINDGDHTTLDALLQGSLLSYDPTAVVETVALSDVATQTITLSASGPLDVAVQLAPYTTLLDRVYGIYASDAPQPTIFHFTDHNPTDLTLMGNFTLGGSGGGDFFGDDFSVVYALADQGDFDNSNDLLVKIDTLTGGVDIVGTLPPAPGVELYSAMGYDAVTNKMYVVSSYADFFGTGGKSLHTIDVNTAQTNLLGTLLSPNQMEVDALAFDDAGNLYIHDSWSQELATVDLETLAVTYITNGGMQPLSEFNSGMDWDPVTKQMYVSIFSYAENGRLYTVDLQTGETTFVEEFGSVAPGNDGLIAPTWIAFASAPLPWATAVPNQLTIPANSSTEVDIVLDTTGLYALGEYTGKLALSGTHVNALASQPITLNVTCDNCGVLNGAVLDAWFNTAVPANLHITGGNGSDIQLTAVPSYTVTVPAGNYTIAATAAGYLPQSINVTASNGLTTTTDILLTPSAKHHSRQSTFWPMAFNKKALEIERATCR
ncbi:MAG: carboxypeptidase regulatory-like domain-containing protein, partial [Anaerolineales bacterium]|nr:carboxypeptidase regulatory-like domain-containing protein [Anaerolineales bacterium]